MYVCFRSGLMVILCTDVLLWLSAVTEDSVHMEIEMEREYKQRIFRAELGTLLPLQRLLINNSLFLTYCENLSLVAPPCSLYS